MNTETSSKTLSPAVFLDRDGVIIVEKNFLVDLDEIEFIPRSLDALRNLDPRFFKVIVSNQSGVARGFFTAEDVNRFQEALGVMLESQGIALNGWYFCPHGPQDVCECRKPKPGLVLRAAMELPINLGKSWMVGDKSSDIAAGAAAGLKTILVNTGYAGKEPGYSNFAPDFVVDDLYEAVNIINKGAIL